MAERVVAAAEAAEEEAVSGAAEVVSGAAEAEAEAEAEAAEEAEVAAAEAFRRRRGPGMRSATRSSIQKSPRIGSSRLQAPSPLWPAASSARTAARPVEA